MKGGRWKRVEALFRDLVEMRPDERTKHLEARCSDAPDVRAEVLSLFVAHDNAKASFQSQLDLDGMHEALETVAGVAPPNQIGPYRFVEELGRGGMGVVYRAERADGQFEQQVALKLIKAGMASDATLGRFLHERQILARLEHPHIAHLLDGGVSDGQPWFAMELVEGQPLTTWCDARKLNVDERIRLFCDVCSAVDYAHRNLVVHRDLKPSNILVTSSGEVKLLDFGIAKLLGGENEAQTQFQTGLDVRPATPEYGAPEQLRGEPVSTATDVWALGAVLYELLSGRPPHEFKNRSLDGVLTVLEETTPARPSSRVASAAAACRATTARRLERNLTGDLDTVVLKTLRREPDRRYAGAHELADDLKRYMMGLPVEARPASWSYRGRRFLQRHWLAAGMTALLVAALTLGLVATAWQARRATRERDRAQREAERTEHVKEFLVDLFQASEPSQARGHEISATDLLERGIEKIETEFVNEPDLRTELLGTVARATRSLGDYERGAAIYRRALELEEQHPKSDALRRADLLAGLGKAYTELLQPVEAEKALRMALDLREQHAGGDSLEVASTLNELGVALLVKNEWQEAEIFLRRALEVHRRVLGDDDVLTLATHYNLAACLLELGEYQTADQALETIAGRQRLILGDHPDFTQTLSTRAEVRKQLGDYIGATRLAEEAVEIRTRILGEEHPRTMVSTNNLAVLLLSTGDDARAEHLMRATHEQLVRQFGPHHPYAALAKGNLARVLTERGGFEEADALLSEALSIHRENSGPDGVRVAEIQIRRAEATLWAGGSLSHPAAEIDRALDVLRAEQDPEVDGLARAVVVAAAIQANLSRTDEAEELYRSALALQIEHHGEDRPAIAGMRHALGDLLVATGRAAEAEPELRQAQEIWRATLPDHHWQQGEALISLGLCLRARGKTLDGDRLVNDGLAHLQASRGPRPLANSSGPPAHRRKQLGVLTRNGKNCPLSAESIKT